MYQLGQAPIQSPETCSSDLARVVIPLATVEVARAQAAAVERVSRSRKGGDHSVPDGSKGGEVLEFAVAHQVRPPLCCLTKLARVGQCRRSGPFRPLGGGLHDRLAFGRKDGRLSLSQQPASPPQSPSVRTDPRRRDCGNRQGCAPDTLTNLVCRPGGRLPYGRGTVGVLYTSETTVTRDSKEGGHERQSTCGHFKAE